MAKSTTDLTISCAQTGTAFAADVTQALIAINSAHRSSTEPTYNLEDGVMWLDTSSSDYKLKMRIGGAWKVIVDLNAGVFQTLSEAGYLTRLDGHDAKHAGTTQSSPNITALEINGTTVTATAAQLNYLSNVTSDVQYQIDQKNGYVHPTTSGWKHVPTGGSVNQILVWSADGTAVWADAAESAPAENTVGQTELKTSSSTFSVSGQSGYVDVTLPGGQYGLMPEFSGSGLGYRFQGTGGSTYATKIQMTGTGTGRQRYFTASPPYNLGDGDIDLFVFLLLDSDNNVKATSVSTTPPWAYNGPTDISPDYYDEDGNGWQKRTIIDTVIVDGVAEATEQKIHRMVDHDLKNADMELIPHPFINTTSLEDYTVVMLNPFQSEMKTVLNSFNSDKDVSEMLTNNITITDGDFTAPPGVSPANFAWSN
jgi:hypothetical protein